MDCQFRPLARAVVRARSLVGDQAWDGRVVVLRRDGVEGGWEADWTDILTERVKYNRSGDGSREAADEGEKITDQLCKCAKKGTWKIMW